jgi:hypothetical protein
LNRLVKNSYDPDYFRNKNISPEDFELLKQYAQKIRHIKKITNKYLNDHPETRLNINRSERPHDLSRNHKKRILMELKKESNLSNYENNLIVESIIRGSNAKDAALKHKIIKPFARFYANEHPELTQDDINELSNNNINKMLPDAKYYNKRNFRHQLEKAIRK